MEKQRAKVDGGLCDWALADGVVVADVACEKCGYSLKTLVVEARCPECGEAVVGSVWAERLCFADLDWMKRVRWGMRLPGAAFVWWIVMAVGLAMGAGMMGVGNFELAMVGCGVLPAVTMVLLGLFLSTQAQGPVGNVLVGLTRHGWLARAAAVVWVGCVGLLLLGVRAATGDWIWVVMALPMVTVAVFCVAVVGLMMHVREIGRVAGNVGLQWRSWLAVQCVLLGWVTVGIRWGFSIADIRPTDWMENTFRIALLLATLLGLLLSLGVLGAASGLMGKQIALARRVRGVG
jgi:hypothetical protein